MRGILLVFVLLIFCSFVSFFVSAAEFNIVVGYYNQTTVNFEQIKVHKYGNPDLYSVFFQQPVFLSTLGNYITNIKDALNCRDRGFYMHLFLQHKEVYFEDFSFRKYEYGKVTHTELDYINIVTDYIRFDDWNCKCKELGKIFKDRERETHIHYSILHPRQRVFHCLTGEVRCDCVHKYDMTITAIENFKIQDPAYIIIFDELKHFREVTPDKLNLAYRRGKDFAVASTNPDVLVKFSDSIKWDDPTTKNSEAYVQACLDKNRNGECDYLEEQEQLCTDASGLKKGEQLLGDCCGFVPYEKCDYYSDKRAFCGNNAENYWSWAPLDEIGKIGDLSENNCLSGMIVSDGTKFLYCGTDINSATSKYSGVTEFGTQKKTINQNDYLCITNKIIECGGREPKTRTALQPGEKIIFNNETLFCNLTGSFTKSITDELTCTNAQLTWTGTKCCGEPNDPDKYYEDLLGGCFNNMPILSGSLIEPEQKIINYKGNFTICESTSPNTKAQRTSHQLFTNTGITPMVKNSCGQPLLEANEQKQHVVCMPWNSWQFTNNPSTTIEKRTVWDADKPVGCCPENECWNGETCVTSGTYYSIGERGFRCAT